VTGDSENPKWAPDVRVRKVRGEILVTAYGDVYALKEVSAEIWSLADGTRSVAEIATAIAERYDVPLGTALRDVRAFVDELVEARLLVQSSL
jgi:hypothetical protein